MSAKKGVLAGGVTAPTRVERDTMGEVEVPADRYWGAQTQRAIAHFRIGTERFPGSSSARWAW